MIVHADLIQRSDEWFALKRGIISGSEVGKFIYGTGAKSAKARQNLIDKKIGEVADGDDTEPSYEDYLMKRGTRLEPDAVAAYQEMTGREVEQVGFVQHDTLPIGVSPDGLMDGRRRGLEMKCPCGKVQIRRLREKVCPPEYLTQIRLGMVVMEIREWDFWSWHPVLPAFLITVRWDAETDKLASGIRAVCAELEQQKRWLEGL